MPSTNSWFVAVGAALALAAPVSAQQSLADAALVPVAAAVQVATPAPVSALAPTSVSAALSVRLAPVMAPAESMLPPQARESQNVALMIVGGAGLVVGSIVGGDTGTIIMVGSGTVGLIGLYRYLR